MKNKILFTMLSLSSLSAQAGEIWFRVSGKLFRAEVPGEIKPGQPLDSRNLIELLEGAQIEEVELRDPLTARAGMWTENDGRWSAQDVTSWTQAGK